MHCELHPTVSEHTPLWVWINTKRGPGLLFKSLQLLQRANYCYKCPNTWLMTVKRTVTCHINSVSSQLSQHPESNNHPKHPIIPLLSKLPSIDGYLLNNSQLLWVPGPHCLICSSACTFLRSQHTNQSPLEAAASPARWLGPFLWLHQAWLLVKKIKERPFISSSWILTSGAIKQM